MSGRPEDRPDRGEAAPEAAGARRAAVLGFARRLAGVALAAIVLGALAGLGVTAMAWIAAR